MLATIMFVDDEIDFLDNVSQYFEQRGYKVIITNNSKNVEKLLETIKYDIDLMFLDINMPGIDGISLCNSLRQKISVPIIFLTARKLEDDIVKGLESGADDYLTKPFSLRELEIRVKAHIRRDTRAKLSDDFYTLNNICIDYKNRKVYLKGKEKIFRRKEFDIMEFLTLNKNLVFSNDYIYDRVWGYDGEGNSSVISEHIRRIRNKFLEEGIECPIETVWGSGYRWKG